MTITTHWSESLRRINACTQAVKWAATQPDLATAWAVCDRGDWMLWLAGKLSGPSESEGRKKLVLAACECAYRALPHFEDPSGYEKICFTDPVLRCIETAEQWAQGEATVKDVEEACHSIVPVCSNEAYAAYCAAYAAFHLPSVAAHAAGDVVHGVVGTGLATSAQCAKIVRKHYPQPPVLPESTP